jgi:group I intron endonuclease
VFYTVYKITNKINNKYYIGKHKTKDLNDGYFGSGKVLKKAIQKYGIENFSKEILHTFDNELEMNAREKELVVISEQTYNLCEGGQGGFSYINNNSLWLTEKHKKAAIENRKKATEKLIELGKTDPEWKKRHSAITSARHASKKENYVHSFQGKKHKPETIELMKKSAKGKHKGSKNSQYGTFWITNGKENKKIRKEELDFWIGLGYSKGRIMSVPRA